MSNIVLNTKTYTGTNNISQGIASWVERSLGLAALFSTVKSSLRIFDKVHIRWDLIQPYPQPEGAPVCCDPKDYRLGDTIIKTRLDPNLSLAERTDHADRLQALVASAQFRASIINLEQQM